MKGQYQFVNYNWIIIYELLLFIAGILHRKTFFLLLSLSSSLSLPAWKGDQKLKQYTLYVVDIHLKLLCLKIVRTLPIFHQSSNSPCMPPVPVKNCLLYVVSFLLTPVQRNLRPFQLKCALPISAFSTFL